jgi:hypothetical protein
MGTRQQHLSRSSDSYHHAEPANVYAGNQALEFALPAQSEELSNAVQKALTTELDATTSASITPRSATTTVTTFRLAR